MKITYRQELLPFCKDPSFFICLLAFGAMAVAATVVTDTNIPATIAFIHVTAQCSGAAFLQSIQYT
jgi:hypothetical protein